MQVTLQSELMVDVQENTSSIMEHSDVIDLVQRKQQRGGVTSASAEDVMTPSERFNVLRLLLTVQHGSWLLIVFYIGMCNGLIWSFAFWHLENIGKIRKNYKQLKYVRYTLYRIFIDLG